MRSFEFCTLLDKVPREGGVGLQTLLVAPRDDAAESPPSAAAPPAAGKATRLLYPVRLRIMPNCKPTTQPASQGQRELRTRWLIGSQSESHAAGMLKSDRPGAAMSAAIAELVVVGSREAEGPGAGASWKPVMRRPAGRPGPKLQ